VDQKSLGKLPSGTRKFFCRNQSHAIDKLNGAGLDRQAAERKTSNRYSILHGSSRRDPKGGGTLHRSQVGRQAIGV
jgi:hypothetical protein